MGPVAFGFSDKGGRSHNEDCAGYRVDGSRGIFVVADGLGGHSSGEVASSLAVNDLVEAWAKTPGAIGPRWLGQAITRANRHIVQEQRKLGNRMRTTVVALVVEGGSAFWAHVGDSRLYHLRDGRLVSVTADHSVAYSKFRSGEITREQIATDPDQSRLLNTLGNSAAPPRVTTASLKAPLDVGDSFLLCTDGTWEYLRDTEILVDRLKSQDPAEWATHCLYRVLDRVGAGHDNLSLMTVTIQG